MPDMKFHQQSTQKRLATSLKIPVNGKTPAVAKKCAEELFKLFEENKDKTKTQHDIEVVFTIVNYDPVFDWTHFSPLKQELLKILESKGIHTKSFTGRHVYDNYRMQIDLGLTWLETDPIEMVARSGGEDYFA